MLQGVLDLLGGIQRRNARRVHLQIIDAMCMHQIDVAACESQMAAIWTRTFTALQLRQRAADPNEQYVEVFQSPQALVQPCAFLQHSSTMTVSPNTAKVLMERYIPSRTRTPSTRSWALPPRRAPIAMSKKASSER